MNEIWQPFTKARINQLAFSFVTLPAITLTAPAWTGSSSYLRRAALYNTSAIALTPFAEPPNDTCIITVSYPINASQSVRYKLWEGVGEIVSAVLYTGQRIGPGAYFELWSVEDQGVVSIPHDLVIETCLTYSALLYSCSGMSTSSTVIPIWPDFPAGSSVYITPTGNMYLRNAETGLYHLMGATGPDGSATITFDPTGVVDPV